MRDNSVNVYKLESMAAGLREGIRQRSRLSRRRLRDAAATLYFVCAREGLSEAEDPAIGKINEEILGQS